MGAHLKIFVYGSLRRGFYNHRLLEKADYLRHSITRAEYRMHSLGGFPSVQPGGTTAIIGEIYDVDVLTLLRLDRLEGHPTLYRRTEITMADGERVSIYIFNEKVHHSDTAIASGDWAVYSMQKGGRA